LFLRVSPKAETGLPPVFCINVPVPSTLKTLPPGLDVVPMAAELREQLRESLYGV
jgi:hypothetical protein